MLRLFALVMLMSLGGCAATTKALQHQQLPRYTVERHQVALKVGQQHKFEHETITLLQQHLADLDGDGNAEQIGVLMVQGGGSGSFYYVAASRWDGGEWYSLGSQFLGDRIILDEVKLFSNDHVDHGTFYVSYHTHGKQQAMSEPPRFYLSKQFGLVDGVLTHLAAY